MVKLTLDKPTTFFTDSPRLMILDEKGEPFYWHTNQERKITFNLPTGTYYSLVPLIQLTRFRPYPHGRIPRFKGDFLQSIRIFPHKNPNKASISLQRRFILVDPKFYYADYKPLKTFTICHELFHNFFHAKNRREKKNRYIHEFIEMQCDNAAKNWMLANGWNPTQVSLAIKLLLRGRNRKDCMQRNTTHPRNHNRR